MSLRIKNWEKFQHYKDRDPPWIKLHRGLLNDPDWHDLDPVAAKSLVMLWMIASENEGNLPDARKLAFRLRTTEIKMRSILQQLSHWLAHDASKPLATCPPETEAETQEKTETELPSLRSDDFPEDFRERFWEAYPRRIGKAGAIGRLERLRRQGTVSWERLLSAVKAYAATADPKFTKHPITWLNQGCWDDEQPKTAEICHLNVNDGLYYAAFDSPEMEAWTIYERAQKKSFPRDKSGGWRFPSQWPPDGLQHGNQIGNPAEDSPGCAA
jgi:hypothetical protein